MNIGSFHSEKLKGFFFLIGGVSLFFFSIGFMVPLFRLALLIFSLGLIADGLMQGRALKAVYAYARGDHAPLLDKETLRGLVFLVAGVLLFLHVAGFLADLFHIIVASAALLLIFYGLKETSFFIFLSKKIKEHESRKKD